MTNVIPVHVSVFLTLPLMCCKRDVSMRTCMCVYEGEREREFVCVSCDLRQFDQNVHGFFIDTSEKVSFDIQ